MARKLFESDPAVDELLDRYSKEAGIKIGKAINQAVYNEFLPRASQLWYYKHAVIYYYGAFIFAYKKEDAETSPS